MSTPSEILDSLQVPYQKEAALFAHTWYRVGGAAETLAHPQHEAQLAELVAACYEKKVPMYLLGSGANLLVRESGVRGIVVMLDAMEFKQVTIEPPLVMASAGCDLAKLVHAAAREGLTGLECMAGVPATVGGALAMNAGGAFGDIGSITKRVFVMDKKGDVESYEHDELNFGYRTGVKGGIILSARFLLKQADPVEVRNEVKRIFDLKKASQPFAVHSAGCAFKNPSKEQPAGMLIDQAGLKGHHIGGAYVSDVHANFIAADETGDADQIIELMGYVQDKVQEHHGVEIQREVVIWPDDGPLFGPKEKRTKKKRAKKV